MKLPTKPTHRLKRAGESIVVKAKYGISSEYAPWVCPTCNRKTSLGECLKCKVDGFKRERNRIRDLCK